MRICSASCWAAWDMKILAMTGVGLMNIRAMIVINGVVSGAPLDKQARQQLLSLSSIRSHYFTLRLRLLLCNLRPEPAWGRVIADDGVDGKSTSVGYFLEGMDGQGSRVG